MTVFLAIWAVLATVIGAVGWARMFRYRRDYAAALALFRSLAVPSQPTPHQRAAKTAKAKRLEKSKAHRLSLAASMGPQV